METASHRLLSSHFIRCWISLRFPNMLREILLFSLLSLAFAANSANEYVDNVLQSSLEEELLSANLLPVRLPQFTVILGSTKYGKGVIEVDFTFGNVTGLDRLKRKGDCSGPRIYKGETTINCTLSLFPLQSAHRTVVRNSTYATVGKVQAAITEVLVDLKIVGRPPNYVGLVRKFDVGSLDSLTPVFSNIPAYLKGELPGLQKSYQRHALGNLYGILSQKYADAIGQAFIGTLVPRP